MWSRPWQCNRLKTRIDPETVERVCLEFEDDCWLEHDESGDFPEEFYRAMADGGWLGIAMPEEFGGAGLGVTEASIMMHTVAKTRGQ